MNRENWDCFCRSTQLENLNSLETVKCLNCFKFAHCKCYEVYNPEAKQNFYCFKCRVILNDPFRDIYDTIQTPICYHLGEVLNSEITFEVPYELFSKVRENQLSVYATFTRLIFEDPKYIDFPDPDNKLVPIINVQNLEHFKRCNIVLDRYIIKGHNRLKLVSNKLKFKCIVGIFVGRIYDVKEVAKKIVTLDPENSESPEESKKNFEVTRFRDMEVLATFNIRDPLTGVTMSIPVRGSKCKHLQCFDFITYLKFHTKETEKPWTCPCCRNIIPWQMLRIDNYIFKILQSIRDKYSKDFLEDVTSITFDEKGNWKFPEEFAKEWETNVNTESKEKKEKEKKKKDKNEIEPEESKAETVKAPLIKVELSIEENINSYNLLYQQYKNQDDGKINELIAKKMKELNSFKNYAPYKFYDFIGKLMLVGGLTIPVVNYEIDQVFYYKNLEEIAEIMYSKKMKVILPLIFSWAKSYEDLIIITLLIITKKKTSMPDLILAIEFFFSYAWFMSTKKISFEGILKQSIYELLGKIINQFGEKLNYGVYEYAVIIGIFRKYFPQIYIPSQTPKKFCQDTEKLFQDRADLIANISKGFEYNDLLKFIDFIYKPPIDNISKDDEKYIRYMYYYQGLILKKYDPNTTDEKILNFFKSWDKYSRVISQIESFKEYSKITNYL